LKGSVLALVDPGSTSGNVAPRALFTEEIGGSELESYFGRIFYSGSHDASILAVVNGKADAAFVADSTAARLVSRGEAKKEDINVLWRTPQIAMDPVVVNSKTMSQDLIGKLKDAYMAMDESEEGRALLKQLKVVKYMPTTDATYDPVRKIVAAKAKMAQK
jgi:phosphonate transport system substrate-binding protein